MNQQIQFLKSAMDEVANEKQQFDHLVSFRKRSTQSIQFPANVPEPVVVPPTNTHEWVNQNLSHQEIQYSQLGRDQCDVFEFPTSESPTASNAQDQVLPTAVALMMAKANRPTSPSILEHYAQTIPLSASCQSIQKRCLFPDCTKMSVSKGLCRGHGGGRRCHFLGGCTKSAQSRSMFCWAHGGGQRCDVESCMRSRKTKRFCVAHMHLETESSGSDSGSSSQTTSAGKILHIPRVRRNRYAPVPTRSSRQPSERMLPSLGQALSAASLTLPSFPILPQSHTRCLDE